MARKQIEDLRFSGVKHDPRFRIPKSKNLKIQLDDRFSKKELNYNKKSINIDKYGRNLKDLQLDDKSGLKDFDRYYKEGGEEKSGSSSEGSESESKPEVIDRARGDEDASSSSESSDNESDTDLSDEEEVDDEEELIIEETKPEEGDPTKRLALVNMDWDNITAMDLFATLSSFIKINQGLIKSIKIYPSEFGKEKMAKEEIEGPSREIFTSKKKVEIDSDSEEEIDLNDKLNLEENREKAIKKLYEEDEGVEYDSKNLRKYQLQRLRYYYAIIECDSILTAQEIYKNCDGVEFEATANFFDLRFVPDEVEFEDDEIKDECYKLNLNYKPKIDFQTTALQHSKVKLTWDETPVERMELTKKAFNNKDLEEMDFKAYLASDSEEEVDDSKNKYKNLLVESLKIGDKNLFDKSNDEDNVDMEITFTPGLNNKEEKEEVKEEIEESTIDKIKRKNKERKKARKEAIKESKKKQVEEKKSKKGHKKNDDDDNKEELELLMMDGQKEKHFDLKEIMKSEKKNNKKKNKKQIDNELIQEDFEVDVNNDDRFKEIFENTDFTIDPNQPEFKKTNTMMNILEERNKRIVNDDDEATSKKKKKLNTEVSNKSNVASLAEKIKNKYKKK